METDQSAQIALAKGYVLTKHNATDTYYCLIETSQTIKGRLDMLKLHDFKPKPQAWTFEAV